ncbi:MAG: hypothetical protein Q4B04_00550 [bacterium]|nr:hypothetical protein [bacterium]
MIQGDTIELLKECNSGIKMGVTSIEEVLEKVKDSAFSRILDASKEEHKKLGDETHELLNKYGDGGKEPHLVAKGMSWIKTNVMLAVNESDKMIAGLIYDGCNMGIKSLNQYLNKYEAAEEKVKDIAKKLIAVEKKLSDDINQYL